MEFIITPGTSSNDEWVNGRGIRTIKSWTRNNNVTLDFEHVYSPSVNSKTMVGFADTSGLNATGVNYNSLFAAFYIYTDNTDHGFDIF